MPIIFTFQSGSIQIKEDFSKHLANTQLYIPIWFYSNGCVRRLTYQNQCFTFQSGSIQIIVVLPCICVYVVFTFQSGSIQMSITSSPFTSSNIFTFQSGSIQISTRDIDMPDYIIKLYIPIWFYSNPSISYHLFIPLEKHFFVDR